MLRMTNATRPQRAGTYKDCLRASAPARINSAQRAGEITQKTFFAFLSMSVAMKPGFTVTTDTPRVERRLRNDSRKLVSPALAAPYAGYGLRPRSPATDEMATIWPDRDSRKRTAARSSC